MFIYVLALLSILVSFKTNLLIGLVFFNLCINLSMGIDYIEFHLNKNRKAEKILEKNIKNKFFEINDNDLILISTSTDITFINTTHHMINSNLHFAFKLKIINIGEFLKLSDELEDAYLNRLSYLCSV